MVLILESFILICINIKLQLIGNSFKINTAGTENKVSNPETLNYIIIFS